MEPDYVVHICGLALERDTAYKPSVETGLRPLPGARPGGARAGDQRRPARDALQRARRRPPTGALACWAGIGLYDWNGTKLDHAAASSRTSGRSGASSQRACPIRSSRRTSTRGSTTTAAPADAAVEDVVRSWLAAGDLAAADERADRRGRPSTAHDPILDVDRVEVHDLFSCRRSGRLPRHAPRHLPRRTSPASTALGRPAQLDVAGLAHRRRRRRHRRARRHRSPRVRSPDGGGIVSTAVAVARADWLDLRDPELYRRDPQDVWARLRDDRRPRARPQRLRRHGPLRRPARVGAQRDRPLLGSRLPGALGAP